MARMYRLTVSTIARVSGTEHDVAVTIPEGTIITVEDDVADVAAGNTEVEVRVGERKAVMFAVDVRDRSEEVKAKRAG